MELIPCCDNCGATPAYPNGDTLSCRSCGNDAAPSYPSEETLRFAMDIQLAASAPVVRYVLAGRREFDTAAVVTLGTLAELAEIWMDGQDSGYYGPMPEEINRLVISGRTLLRALVPEHAP